MKEQETLKSSRSISLYVDTTKTMAVIYLFEQGREIVGVDLENRQLSETLIPTLISLCSQNGVALSDIVAIYVNPGPGSYTGLRIGVTTANLLAFTLNRPIYQATSLHQVGANNINAQFSSPIVPFYANPPHITTPRPRLR